MALIASKTSCRSLQRVSTAFDFYRILRYPVWRSLYRGCPLAATSYMRTEHV